MPKHIGDPKIGIRATEELYRKFPQMTEKEISERIKLNRKSFWEWKTGRVPGGYMLQKLCHAGLDIKYILTGKRAEKAHCIYRDGDGFCTLRTNEAVVWKCKNEL